MGIDINNYKVTIVVPTYKRSMFLDRAIYSILHQSHNNIEIIVVDDNDPNSNFRMETEEKMVKYKSNEKIIYVRNPKNLGGALARNEGIYRATGDFVTFLDDDDIYLPDKIRNQLEFMLINRCDLSFTDVRFHNSDDKLIDYREHKYVKNLSNEELLKQHIMHHLTPTATYMFKKESLLRIGGFDDVQMGQEFMLMLKAIEDNLKIGYIPIAKVIQYIHNGERISVGQNKLDKEVELYKFKQRYFYKLTSKQKRYVKFRHHAVMAVAGKRSGNISVSLSNLFFAVLTSPSYCIEEFLSHISKLRKNRRIK